MAAGAKAVGIAIRVGGAFWSAVKRAVRAIVPGLGGGRGKPSPAGYLRRLGFEAFAPRVLLDAESPWHNSDQPTDVDADGQLTPLDALIIVNRLNAPRDTPPPASFAPGVFPDVDGDHQVTEADFEAVVAALALQTATASDAPSDGETRTTLELASGELVFGDGDALGGESPAETGTSDCSAIVASPGCLPPAGTSDSGEASTAGGGPSGGVDAVGNAMRGEDGSGTEYPGGDEIPGDEQNPGGTDTVGAPPDGHDPGGDNPDLPVSEGDDGHGSGDSGEPRSAGSGDGTATGDVSGHDVAGSDPPGSDLSGGDLSGSDLSGGDTSGSAGSGSASGASDGGVAGSGTGTSGTGSDGAGTGAGDWGSGGSGSGDSGSGVSDGGEAGVSGSGDGGSPPADSPDTGSGNGDGNSHGTTAGSETAGPEESSTGGSQSGPPDDPSGDGAANGTAAGGDESGSDASGGEPSPSDTSGGSTSGDASADTAGGGASGLGAGSSDAGGDAPPEGGAADGHATDTGSSGGGSASSGGDGTSGGLAAGSSDGEATGPASTDGEAPSSGTLGGGGSEPPATGNESSGDGSEGDLPDGGGADTGSSTDGVPPEATSDGTSDGPVSTADAGGNGGPSGESAGHESGGHGTASGTATSGDTGTGETTSGHEGRDTSGTDTVAMDNSGDDSGGISDGTGTSGADGPQGSDGHGEIGGASTHDGDGAGPGQSDGGQASLGDDGSGANDGIALADGGGLGNGETGGVNEGTAGHDLAGGSAGGGTVGCWPDHGIVWCGEGDGNASGDAAGGDGAGGDTGTPGNEAAGGSTGDGVGGCWPDSGIVWCGNGSGPSSTDDTGGSETGGSDLGGSRNETDGGSTGAGIGSCWPDNGIVFCGTTGGASGSGDTGRDSGEGNETGAVTDGGASGGADGGDIAGCWPDSGTDSGTNSGIVFCGQATGATAGGDLADGGSAASDASTGATGGGGPGDSDGGADTAGTATSGDSSSGSTTASSDGSASGTSTGSSGTDTSGTGTAGDDTVGSSGDGEGGNETASGETSGGGGETAGNDGGSTAGSGSSGNDAAGSSGSDSAGSDSAGNDSAGNDSAGNDTAGNDTAGSDTAGSDTAGSDTAGSGTVGSDTIGHATAGSDAAGAGGEATGSGGGASGGTSEGAGTSGGGTGSGDPGGTTEGSTAGGGTTGGGTTGGTGTGGCPPGEPNAAPVAHDDPDEDDPATPHIDFRYPVGHRAILEYPAPGVLWNDHDRPCDKLTAHIVANARHGTVTLNPNGSFRYDPDDHYVGPDSFTYQAKDGALSSNTATVYLEVLNELPVAQDDTYVAVFQTHLQVPPIGVLANDVDVDGDLLTAIMESFPAHGTAVLLRDGSFRYTPNNGFVGTDHFTYRAHDGFGRSEPATVWITVVLPEPDIDTDSDNNGVIDGTPEEDAVELDPPGNILRSNFDDDNRNGVSDADEAPLLDANGNPVADDDLEPVRLNINDAGANLAGFELRLVMNGINVYRSPAKEPMPRMNFLIGTDPIPETVWVEGGVSGINHLFWHLHNPAGQQVSVDSVRFTTVHTQLIPYRPQTEGPGYGQPFQRTPVPDHQHNSVGIRRNGDDDNADGVPDGLLPFPVAQENDTIEVEIRPAPDFFPGIRYGIATSNANLGVFETSDRGTPLLNLPRLGMLNSNPIWVDWYDNVPVASADLMLEVFDAISGNFAFIVDTITFVPFRSVVIVLGGRGHSPSDPATPGEGIFRLATDIYREDNYDVHMYSQNAVNLWGQGAAYNEIVSAINTRGVTEVAILGYSWGGGSTYDLSWRLNENVIGNLPDIALPFSVPLTGYIDAIRSALLDAEDRRPLLSLFHCNQFQSTDWPLHGARSGGDDDIDRSYLNVNHLNIDDHLSILFLLRDRLHQRVTR